jgi:hypothetical protein
MKHSLDNEETICEKNAMMSYVLKTWMLLIFPFLQNRVGGCYRMQSMYISE